MEHLKAVPPTTKRLLNMTEAAAYLGLSKLTLYEWVSQRKIEYVKVGRLVKFDSRQLERWIEKHTVKALNHEQQTAAA